MKIRKRITYIDWIAYCVILCILLLLVLMIKAYQHRTYIDGVNKQMESRNDYRERIKKELVQLKLDYAMSSRKIVTWIGQHVIPLESVDLTKEYNEQELEEIDASTYVDTYWKDIDSWNVDQYTYEVNMFIFLYGKVFSSNEDFSDLLMEREQLYYTIEKLTDKLNDSYGANFEWSEE